MFLRQELKLMKNLSQTIHVPIVTDNTHNTNTDTQSLTNTSCLTRTLNSAYSDAYFDLQQ